MAPKRRLFLAAGNGSVPPPEKRLRTDSGIPEPAPAEPPSPRWRLLRQTVLVVLFLIRAKDKNMDFSLAQVGRVVREQIRRCLGPIFSKLESMDGRICALTQKVDNIANNSRTGHNHKQHMQETNQEGNSGEAEGLATNEGKSKRKRIRLQFLNGMKPLIYHEDEIRSDRDSATRIGIFDGNNMIRSGQLSTLKIEILALNGDFPYDASDIWTSAKFNEYRVGDREGKGSVLAGKCTVRLVNGEVDLNNIKFIKGSCSAPNKMFIVGARVCDSEQTDDRIQEVIMNPVVVQDRRNKSNEKSHPPKLTDKVHRLEEIANGGKYGHRLGQENIVTVEDFLKALNKDPDNLARILKIKTDYQAWKKMVKHAHDCCLDGNNKLKSYCSAEGNAVLFFNCVDRLVGAKFGDHYIPSDMFDPAKLDFLDKLKKDAYAQFGDLIDDHVMTDKGPVPIYMDADVGPSYKATTTQKTCSAQFTSYQGCEDTFAVEGFNHAQIELSCANVDKNHGPSTHNDQCIGTRLVLQEQSSSASLNGWCQDVLRRSNSPGTSEELCFDAQYDGTPCLQNLEYTFNYVSPFLYDYAIQQEATSSVAPPPVEIQSQGQCNHILEPATAAHSNMTLTTQQLVGSGAPGVAEGNVQRQVQTRLAHTGAFQPSNSAQNSVPQGQWSQFQGNMAWNGSL